MEDKIQALLAPIADEVGVDVLKVSLGGNRTPTLQVVVDRRGGVDSDMLERVSRGLALQLDVEDLIKSNYRLEVTSPGYDWIFTTEADFARYQGDWIRIQLPDGTALEGENQGLSDHREVILTDDKGKEHRVAWDDSTKVKRTVNWQALKRRKQ